MMTNLQPSEKFMDELDAEKDAETELRGFLSAVNEMREENQFVDVTIVVEGVEYRAHKLVLASRSPYFHAMFTSGLEETHSVLVHLAGVTGRGFKPLLRYIYTNHLEVDERAVVDVVAAATHLQLLPALSLCSQYLSTRLSTTSCVDILRISDIYSLPTLKQDTLRFICANFSRVATTTDFLQLDVDELVDILSTDFVVDCQESHLVAAIIWWLQQSPVCRLVHADRLLACIHFPSVDPTHETFTEVLDADVFTGIRRELPQLLHYFYMCLPPGVREGEGYVNLRGLARRLVVVGGVVAGKGLSSDIWYHHTPTRQWKLLTSMPGLPQTSFGCATLGNKLYMTGGCMVNPHTQEECVHPYGLEYNVMNGEWSSMPKMAQERQCHYMCGVAGSLYVVGGVGEVEACVAETTCERYDVSTRQWCAIPALPCPIYRFTGAVCGHHIFISGGLTDGGVVSRHLLSYDTVEQRWEEEQMSGGVGRVDHCVVAHEGSLYFIGGWYVRVVDGESVKRPCLDVERYDVGRKEWSVVGRMPTARHSASSSVDDGQIWVVGGCTNCDGPPYNPAAENIIVYNIDTREWKSREVKGSALQIWEQHGVSMLLPK